MKDKIKFKKQFIEANRVDLESKLIPPLALVGAIISFVGFFVNLLGNFDITAMIIPIIAFIFYLGSYFFSRQNRYRSILKWLILFFTIVIFNALWFNNFGSRGPVLYIFVVIYSFFIFVFNRKEAAFLSILAAINIVALFIIEYHNPNIVGHYYSDRDRIIDVYSALVYFGLIFYVLLSIARNAYFSEYKKAKRADRLKSSFLANMSHEIRTPLNAIVGFSNILADEELSPDDRKQYASIINSSNGSLLRLVNDILDVSLIESDQLNLVIQDCDVSSLMDNMEKTYLLKLKGDHKLQLVNKTKAERAFVKTDCARFQQVMVNLLDNAIKYTDHGTVEFGFSVEDKELKFSVKDTGIGIKEENKGYLFDRFFKVEDDNSKLFRGTGIGLYLTKKIVEMLGGKIWVDSEYGKGSVFYFTIPKNDYRLEVNPEHLVKRHRRFPGVNKIKILIIEDHKSNQQYYKAILKDAIFEVLQAFDGKEGLEVFQKNPDVHLILLDLKMPDMDGFKVLEEIRKKDPKIPVIAQTAYAMAGDKEKCMGAGFNDYISKPIEKDNFLKIISRYFPPGS